MTVTVQVDGNLVRSSILAYRFRIAMNQVLSATLTLNGLDRPLSESSVIVVSDTDTRSEHAYRPKSLALQDKTTRILELERESDKGALQRNLVNQLMATPTRLPTHAEAEAFFHTFTPSAEDRRADGHFKDFSDFILEQYQSAPQQTLNTLLDILRKWGYAVDYQTQPPTIVNATTPNDMVHSLSVPLRGTSSKINYDNDDVGFKGITKRLVNNKLEDVVVQTRQQGKIVDLGKFPTLARFNALANISQTLAALTVHSAKVVIRLNEATVLRLYDQVTTPSNLLTHDLWRIDAMDFNIKEGQCTLSCSGVAE